MIRYTSNETKHSDHKLEELHVYAMVRLVVR